MLAPPGLQLDEPETFQRGDGEQGRGGRRENVGARSLQQPFDHGAVARDEGAGYASSLAQRTQVDNARRLHVEVRQHAAPGFTQHAESMRVVE